MKPALTLIALIVVFFTACSNDAPPVSENQDPVDSVPENKPEEPDPGCLVNRENVGNLTGEWMEAGTANGVVSEIECIKVDTTGMATRRERQWAFKNDSLFYSLNKDGGRAYYFKINASRDTMTMVDDHHMFYDTLRITRLDSNILIVASPKQSVLYMRRK